MPSPRDVIILGGGISAHTAALYSARAALQPLIISGEKPDQLSLTTLVENFPGFPNGINGPDLVTNARQQAEKFGAQYQSGRATAIQRLPNGFFEVTTTEGIFQARTVIISTGADARVTGIPGEKEFFGRGVSTCAVCDAALYRGKETVVIGGGDSAMEESLALYKFAKKVTIVHRRDTFRASQIMQDRMVGLKDKVTVLWDSVPMGVLGDKLVSGVKIKNLKTGVETILPADGMFLAIGHIPNTDFLKDFLTLDANGFIITQGVKTSQPGVFAAGDVMDPRYKQAITSAGTGCQAALEAEWYIEHLKAEGKYES
ncbi:MAG: thioredoxin-disulfide reductase [Candidatus Diapherotrites archaeon]|nr:thioredoxin-disulfide reductase [Candidatus Diapherotrites archaeon]MDZ4256566.1 thioredoxin-disulfide reductase [archaeon]